jgi:hypothetical protein
LDAAWGVGRIAILATPAQTYHGKRAHKEIPRG